MNPLPQLSQPPQVYRIFDICVASDFPLPGLVASKDKSPDWTISLGQQNSPEDGFEWFHNWKTPDGQEVMASARKQENYLLKFPGLVVFLVDFDEHVIHAYPEPGCPENTLAHLLIDQVIPRVMGHGGRMVIHASAVELTDGRVVVFTGPSGRGKSTLAMAMLNSGHRLISDDCLLLENRGGEIYGIASYPSLRLWADSAAAMAQGKAIRGARVSKMAHYTNKQQLLFEGRGAAAESGWVKMSALYILDAVVPGQIVQRPVIEPTGGMNSLMALIEALFVLDVVRKEQVKKNFEVVRSIAGLVPVFHLYYPRDFSKLPQIVEKVAEFRPLVERKNTV